MIQFLYNSCGIFYFSFFVLSLLGLGAVGIRIMFGRLSFNAVIVYMVLAMSPLLMGIRGTAEGYRSVNVVSHLLTAEERASGLQVARVTTYVGGLISAPFLALGLAALYRIRSRKTEDPS